MNNDPQIIEENAISLLNKKNIFDYFFINNSNKEDAAEKYKIAANLYKIQDKYEDSVRCYKKIIEIYEILGEKTNEILVQLAVCYEKLEDNYSLVEIYIKLSNYYFLISNISRFNEFNLEISKIYEKTHQYEECIKYINLCIQDERTYLQVLEKKSYILIQLKSYKEAFEINKSIIEIRLKKNSFYTLLHKYIFKGLLCILASGDFVMLEIEFNNFKNIHYQFEDSIEGTFIKNITDSINNLDSDNFEVFCIDFDKIHKLSPEEVALLLEIKNHITCKIELDLS